MATEPSLERVEDRQRALLGGPHDDDTVLEVLAPFKTASTRGPDLRFPRPELRIVPGKLSGAPHIAQTRVESESVAALSRSGLPMATIYELYPEIGHRAIDQAVDLEQQLAENLGRHLRAA